MATKDQAEIDKINEKLLQIVNELKVTRMEFIIRIVITIPATVIIAILGILAVASGLVANVEMGLGLAVAAVVTIVYDVKILQR